MRFLGPHETLVYVTKVNSTSTTSKSNIVVSYWDINNNKHKHKHIHGIPHIFTSSIYDQNFFREKMIFPQHET